MLKRVYVHNYKCLVNFEFKVDEDESFKHLSLFIGKNGAGKSTLAEVLQVFQRIGRKQSNLKPLEDGVDEIKPVVDKDRMAMFCQDSYIQFELTVEIGGHSVQYILILELPRGFSHLRVKEEKFFIDGNMRFTRTVAEIQFSNNQANSFVYDWHLIYLPIYNDRDKAFDEVLKSFMSWMGNIIILSPIPQNMQASLRGASSHIKPDGSNIADWFVGLLERNPDAYSEARETYLKSALPDFKSVCTEADEYGKKFFYVIFVKDKREYKIRLDSLSDGERCLVLMLTILMANKSREPFLCFWDEPDSYLANSEIEYFIAALVKQFLQRGQIWMTTHHPETILHIPEHNIYLIYRKDHASHTRLPISVAEWRERVGYKGDFLAAWRQGDTEWD
ncbi:MAG: AAA family ATPase [Candidatus Accumulibacter sp.]|jgi:AAA15 family ATPase/GTPase|nr:AAA family ATPase [Accumulibacter sp.]